MNETLQSIAVLIAALLWGGVVTVDFVVTPARFATPNVDRSAINAVGQVIFRYYGYVQVVLALALAVVVVVGKAGQQVILPSIFLLVLALLNAGALEPAMRAMQRATLSPQEIAAKANARKQLHRAYMASDFFRMILGGIVIVALVTI